MNGDSNGMQCQEKVAVKIVIHHGRLICSYFANSPIQKLFYGAHVWSAIKVKAVWF